MWCSVKAPEHLYLYNLSWRPLDGMKAEIRAAELKFLRGMAGYTGLDYKKSLCIKKE
jgi:hypothetical protein